MSSIWLTNSALVYEPECGEVGDGLRGLSHCVQLYIGAQVNFKDLTYDVYERLYEPQVPDSLTYSRKKSPNFYWTFIKLC